MRGANAANHACEVLGVGAPHVVSEARDVELLQSELPQCLKEPVSNAALDLVGNDQGPGDEYVNNVDHLDRTCYLSRDGLDRREIEAAREHPQPKEHGPLRVVQHVD